MKRFLPLIFILSIMLLAYFLDLGQFLSFASLQEHRQELQQLVDKWPLLAPLAYIGIYILAVAVSFPGASFLTLAGGFLFPQPFSTIYTVTGATLGASAIFFAASTAFAESLRERAGPFLSKMQTGFKENAMSYLLFLRLVPAFPFWLVNLAPAILGVPFRTYLIATATGIIPGTFVFTQAGAGLGAIFDTGEAFSIGSILNNDMKVALVALGVISLLPTIITKLRSKGSYD